MGKDKNKKKDEPKETPETEILDGAVEEETADPTEALGKQVAELTDRLARSLAEFDNFRKRTVKEKSEMYDIGVISAAERILPVVDNFLRALDSAPDKNDNMYKGILMIYRQLDEALKELGIEAIECMGESFDPRFHDAAAHEKNDKYDENTIIEELRKGYKYKDKVIRPSMVKVAN